MGAVTCPVCCGRCTMPKSFYDGPSTDGENPVQCKSCGGTGIIRDCSFPVPKLPYEAPREYDPYYPWIPSPKGHGGYCACKQCVPPVICSAPVFIPFYWIDQRSSTAQRGKHGSRTKG